MVSEMTESGSSNCAFPKKWYIITLKLWSDKSSECNEQSLWEKTIQTVYKVFQQSHFFADIQFGFRNQYSCLHAIAQLSELLRESYDLQIGGYACFIDIEKAFDTI